MGLPLTSACRPTPTRERLDSTDDRLTAGVHVDVLDRDFLLSALATVASTLR